jgi:hypothetical protein
MNKAFMLILFFLPSVALAEQSIWNYLEVSSVQNSWTIFRGTATVSLTKNKFLINSDTRSIDSLMVGSFREIKGDIKSLRKTIENIPDDDGGVGITVESFVGEVEAIITHLYTDVEPYTCEGKYQLNKYSASFGHQEEILLNCGSNFFSIKRVPPSN